MKVDVFTFDFIFARGEDGDFEGPDDEGVEDEDTIKEEATVFPEDDIGVDTYIPQQIDVEDEVIEKRKQLHKQSP